jgi:signal transduction histidine kinase
MREGLTALGRRVGESLMVRTTRHRRFAWAIAVLGPVLVAASLIGLRPSVGLAGYLFATMLVAVAAAVTGGRWSALAAAAIAVPLGDFYFAPPYGSVTFEREGDLFVFVGFVVVVAVVGILVDQLLGLFQQQAALRRVATLVAGAATAEELFAAVTEEVGQQLPVDFVRMARYESDHSITFVAARGTPNEAFGLGMNMKIEEVSVSGLVLRTGQPARIDNYGDVPGLLGQVARTLGMRSAVGVPIIVEDRIWGMMLVGSPAKFPADTEARLASFMDLLSTAIANAESRTELAASRARVVAAADETRRRIERDLHDGTQQRLVSLAMELRAAEGRVPSDLPDARTAFSSAARGLTEAVEDLQEISRGIHPAILSKGGLTPAIKTLARRSAVAVELDLQVADRLPRQVEVAAYYIVSEALTNVAKYAQASLVHVDVHANDSVIELAVRDDGIGGADPSRGSGLVGLKDRVEALGGTITFGGGPGDGTSVEARIPLDGKSLLEAERRRAAAPRS